MSENDPDSSPAGSSSPDSSPAGSSPAGSSSPDPSPVETSVAETSVVVAIARDLRDLRRWLETSSVAGLARRASAGLDRTARNSALARFLALLAAWTRQSFLYRWLTSEPDPEVVVIDLRETYTVGPIVALLDRLIPQFARTWSYSGLNRALDRAVSALRRAPIRVLGITVAAAVAANVLVAAATGSLSLAGGLARAAVLAGALAATRVRVSWDALARARTVRLLVAALEPPEPPGEDNRE